MIDCKYEVSTGVPDNSSGRHVLFLLPTLVVGGSERKTVRITNALAASGRKVSIAYLNAPHSLRDEISNDVEVVCLDRKGKFSFAALRRLMRHVSSMGVHEICCVNNYALIYGFLCRFFLNGTKLRILASINDTEFVRWIDKIKMFLYAPILRRIDAVIFGSGYQKKMWVKQYRLNEPDCTYIYNGVDTNWFSRSGSGIPSQKIRRDLAIPEERLVIGSVGRFRKEKQYQMVIKAVYELRKRTAADVHCVLVGGGYEDHEEQLLRNLVAELNLESCVHLIDAVDDVRPYLEAIDIFVLSSISETFSNAALEAMAMKLPVVLPRVGGCPEMVRFGETGFIYQPGDVSDFVDFLCLLGADEKMRVNMGEAAGRYVEANFKFETMVLSYANLFDSVQ